MGGPGGPVLDLVKPFGTWWNLLEPGGADMAIFLLRGKH